ncbi:hypothetical protein RCL1_001750 [Eukaryota sp. TZLM3-RCL]
MISGHRYEGPSVDIWSMGIILYALICGYLPFEDPSTPALYAKILSGKFSIPPFVSKEAASLMRGILTVDPHRRFSIEDIRRHPWYCAYQDPASTTCNYTSSSKTIDDSIICQLESLGFDRETALSSLQKNKHNSITATYHLLLDKKISSGGAIPNGIKSVAPVIEAVEGSSKSRRKSTKQSKLSTLDTIPEDDSVAAIGLLGSEEDSHSDFVQSTPSSRRNSEDYDYLSTYRKAPVNALKTSLAVTDSPPSRTVQDRRRHSYAPSCFSNDESSVSSLSATTPVSFASTNEGIFSRHQPAIQTLPVNNTKNSSHYRRASIAVDSGSMFALEKSQVNTSNDIDSMKVHKGVFNVQSTSQKSPVEILKNIKTALGGLGISFTETSEFLVDCQYSTVKFNMEIRKLFGFDALFVVVYQRVTGDTWRYKNLCQEIGSKLDL